MFSWCNMSYKISCAINENQDQPSHPNRLVSLRCPVITKTRLFKYIENFTTKKNENFQRKNSDIFHIPAQNIDCGYSLEPPRRGGSNEYPQSMFLSINKKSNVYQCKHQFYCIKVGFKAVKIILACFRDVKTFKIQFYPQVTLRKLYSDCANAHSV